MSLAMELASGMAKPSDIFARHGYSRGQIAVLLQNPQFISMLQEAKSNWESNANAEERIRLKAKLALEEILPTHFALATSAETPAAARNEAVKTFERLSGLAKPEGSGGSAGERFVVNINLGDKPGEVFTVDSPALEEPADA